MLGAEWEKDILSGREDILEGFKNNYISIQQAIAEAAWNSANEQIKAAKEAAKGADGTTGSSGSITSEKKTSSEPSETAKTYHVIRKEDGDEIATFATQKEANSYLNKLVKGNPDDEVSNYLIKKYHDGLDSGYVTSKYRQLNSDEMLQLFQKFSHSQLKPDEVPAILKRGELVMTPAQQTNIAKNMQMLYGNNFAQYDKVPQATTITIGDIQLYGVQDVNDLSNQIVKRLPNVMLQAINKR